MSSIFQTVFPVSLFFWNAERQAFVMVIAIRPWNCPR